MDFTIQKLAMITACVLALLAADVRADDAATDSRPVLSNRELATAGLAISVTVRGDQDCGIGGDTSQDEKRRQLSDLLGRDTLFPKSKPSQTSGVILNADGEILSLSVTESCSSFLVTLPDGREVTAEPVGFDDVTDLALLRVSATGLNAARIGDPNTLRPGDRVLAFGSPFGMERTLSEGLVSTARRYLPAVPGSHYIHSDAMINPGSAGGPLLNEYGEVVGVHALLFARRSSFEGMAFALPIDMAMRLVEDLREFGHVRRAWLGLSLENSEAGEPGAIVTFVEANSPATDAVHLGDVIVAFDGQPVATPDGLRRLIQMYRAGATVSITLVRGESSMELALTLAERPEE